LLAVEHVETKFFATLMRPFYTISEILITDPVILILAR